MDAGPAISVIVPTTASRVRAQFLKSAVASILSQQGVQGEALLVVNGASADPAVIDHFQRFPGVRILRLPDANLPAALAHGREGVRTDFFSQLDDDDEFLPGALHLRLQALEIDDRIDAVVSRGLLWGDGAAVGETVDFEPARADPLMAMLDSNWLYPGSALYRSSTIGREYFREMPSNLEWTYFGARLALERRIAFLDDITFRYRIDNPHSITKTAAYVLAQPNAVKALLSLDLPAEAIRRINQKISIAHHACSTLHLTEGRYWEAWNSHLQSLKFSYGLRYFAYARHFLRALGRNRAEGRCYDVADQNSVPGDRRR